MEERQWTALRIECQSRTRRTRFLAGRLIFNEEGEYQYFVEETGQMPDLPFRVTLKTLDTTLRVGLRTYLSFAQPSGVTN